MLGQLEAQLSQITDETRRAELNAQWSQTMAERQNLVQLALENVDEVTVRFALALPDNTPEAVRVREALTEYARTLNHQ